MFFQHPVLRSLSSSECPAGRTVLFSFGPQCPVQASLGPSPGLPEHPGYNRNDTYHPALRLWVCVPISCPKKMKRMKEEIREVNKKGSQRVTKWTSRDSKVWTNIETLAYELGSKRGKSDGPASHVPRSNKSLVHWSWVFLAAETPRKSQQLSLRLQVWKDNIKLPREGTSRPNLVLGIMKIVALESHIPDLNPSLTIGLGH